MDLDVDALYSVHILQVSACKKDQIRLVSLLNSLATQQGCAFCASLLLGENDGVPSLDTLPAEQKHAIRFVCLKGIESYISQSDHLSDADASALCSLITELTKWIINANIERGNPKFIQNKICHLASLAIYQFYPKQWHSCFHDLLQLVTNSMTHTNGQNANKTEIAIEIYLDILEGLDASLVCRENQLTTLELARSTEIKDNMRETCIPFLVTTWFELLQSLDVTNSQQASLINKCLSVIGLYAAWVDVTLIANETLMGLLLRYLESSVTCNEIGMLIRRGVFACMSGLVTKGMTSPDKILLITELWNRLGQLILSEPQIAHALKRNYGFNSNSEDESSEYIDAFSLLLSDMGLQLVEAYRNLVVANDVNVPTALCNMEIFMDMALCFPGDLNVVKFVLSYVSLLKVPQSPSQFPPANTTINSTTNAKTPARYRNRPTVATSVMAANKPTLLNLTPVRRKRIERLMWIAVEKARCPEDHDFSPDCAEFDEDRHEWLTTVSNLAVLDAQLVLSVIKELIEREASYVDNLNIGGDTNGASVSWERVTGAEIALTMLFHIGEAIKAPKNSHFTSGFAYHEEMCALMARVCSSNFSSFPHWAVQAKFFEIVARYERFFSVSRESLPPVIFAFLDGRGLWHTKKAVRLRCAYLFSQIVKSHKTTLTLHIGQLLAHISDLLQLNPDPVLEPIDEDGNPIRGGQTNLTNGAKGDSHQLNFTSTSTNEKRNRLLSESCGSPYPLDYASQAYLYEAAAQLIIAHSACKSESETDCSAPTVQNETINMFRVLLSPALQQLPVFVDRLLAETNPEMAQARGLLTKQTVDLITRTSKVFNSTQTLVSTNCLPLFLEALDMLVVQLSRLPSVRQESAHVSNDVSVSGSQSLKTPPFSQASRGRPLLATGIRAFIHRLVAVLSLPASSPPSTNNGSNSITTPLNDNSSSKDITNASTTTTSLEWQASHVLLEHLIVAWPQLIPCAHQALARVQRGYTNFNSGKPRTPMYMVADGEVQIDQLIIDCKELRAAVPLINQVWLKYKEHCRPLLEVCLPGLLVGMYEACSLSLDSQLESLAVEEQRLLRRGFSQLMQLLCTMGGATCEQSGGTAITRQQQTGNVSADANNILTPKAILDIFHTNRDQILLAVIGSTESCLQHEDLASCRSGIAWFVQMLTALVNADYVDEQLFTELVLGRLVPLCVLGPARLMSLLTGNELNLSNLYEEIAACLHWLAHCSPKAQSFVVFLRDQLLPQQSLPPDHIANYVNAVQTLDIKPLTVFFKDFYSSFR